MSRRTQCDGCDTRPELPIGTWDVYYVLRNVIRVLLLVGMTVYQWVLIYKPLSQIQYPAALESWEPHYQFLENGFTYRINPQCRDAIYPDEKNASAFFTFIQDTADFPPEQKKMQDPMILSLGCHHDSSLKTVSLQAALFIEIFCDGNNLFYYGPHRPYHRRIESMLSMPNLLFVHFMVWTGDWVWSHGFRCQIM